LILFIGYCAEHTLGAQILAGRNPVNIFGEPYPVRAKITSIDSYSGHADKNELKHYVENISGNLKKIICIHGEEAQCLANVEALRAMKPSAEVFAPKYKEAMEI
jgi:metallo-beta-lactamase family protein